MDSTTRPVSGSHSFAHVGMVFSTHSARLHASIVCSPDGSAVTSFNQRSASRSASWTCA